MFAPPNPAMLAGPKSGRSPDVCRPPAPPFGVANYLPVVCLEVDADLGAEHWRVLEMSRAARPNDVLEVGLDK
jgi:hypothetical protein